jgi:formate-dependent nitrite reductase membrane component NrfD
MTSRARYEQFLQDLKQEYRPQRDWGEGKGVFLVIGHFVVGVAAGAWLCSLVFNQPQALILSYILGAIGGISHLAFLGHPTRFWRMCTRVKTSWISRGFCGLSFFLLGGILYLPAVFAPNAFWQTGSFLGGLGYILAFVGMLILLGYMGFCYSASKAIPFWHSSLHPALYVAYALRGGVAALLVTIWMTGQDPSLAAALLPYWVGVTAVVIVFFLLEIHGAMTGGNEAAKRSVHELFAGRVALYFYAGTLLLGLVIPAYLSFKGFSGVASFGAMAALGLASALGDFFMKFSTVRAGVHLPLWTNIALRHG